MIKKLLALTLLGLLIYSCSSVEQTQTDSSQSPDQPTVSESDVPAWYSHEHRALSDSTSFTGLGMAVSTDSSSAEEQALAQATSFMMHAIDAYLEETRKMLVEDESVESLTSQNSILSIRQAVQDLELENGVLQTEVSHKADDDQTVIAYSRVSVERSVVVEKLSALISNSDMLNAIRSGSESSAK